MEKRRIDRINELARKAKIEGLTDAEKAEQKKLREEYLEGFRRNVINTLEHTYIMDEEGHKRKLQKKEEKDRK